MKSTTTIKRTAPAKVAEVAREGRASAAEVGTETTIVGGERDATTKRRATTERRATTAIREIVAENKTSTIRDI